MTAAVRAGIDRRQLLWLAGAPVLSAAAGGTPTAATAATGNATVPATTARPPSGPTLREPRVRPGDAGWPSAQQWGRLRREVGDAWVDVRAPWAACTAAPASPDCARLFTSLKNPYFLGDEIGLTQTLGWVDAWTSRASVHAVAARGAGDVVAAVNFAREHRLRLVVKGGGHSYQGTSNAADSLLVWTRRMNDVRLHEAFVAQGGEGTPPQRAVSIGAGALWAHVYDAVTTRGGGYVQGGGCTTVGVAGLVQSGGFGSFSKAFGTAAGSLLEAEVVTADGVLRVANARTNPDLFWALKGGGGGAFGVLTRLTLKVHPLPQTFGAVNFKVKASTPAAFARLIAATLDFCERSLVGPHWGEQLRLRGDDTLAVSMVFQGLSRSEATAVWRPFLAAVEASPEWQLEFAPLKIVSTPARDFWSPTFFKRALGFIAVDDRPGAPKGNVFWPGDQGQAGQVLHGYGSTWLSKDLLRPDKRPLLADALFAATRHRHVSLHLNKGLAGAPAEAVARARDTAMNPAALDAFALLITGAGEQPAYPGVAGREPDVARARANAQAVRRCMAEIAKAAPQGGAYVAESDYFQPDWGQAFWGEHHARLRAVKQRHDPQGLFFVHHGVGSERWSADGFDPVGA